MTGHRPKPPKEGFAPPIPDPIRIMAARIAHRAGVSEVPIAVFEVNGTAVLTSTGTQTYDRAIADPLRVEHLVGIYHHGACHRAIYADMLEAGVTRAPTPKPTNY